MKRWARPFELPEPRASLVRFIKSKNRENPNSGEDRVITAEQIRLVRAAFQTVQAPTTMPYLGDGLVETAENLDVASRIWRQEEFEAYSKHMHGHPHEWIPPGECPSLPILSLLLMTLLAEYEHEELLRDIRMGRTLLRWITGFYREREVKDRDAIEAAAKEEAEQAKEKAKEKAKKKGKKKGN